MSLALVLAGASLGVWVYLLIGRGGFWRVASEPMPTPPAAWPHVVAVIPARDEAAAVGRAVASLLGQDYPGELSVVLVDDHSGDGTAEIARAAAFERGAADRLAVVAARPLAPGWTGKLWAIAEGLRHVAGQNPTPDYVLLTDADIEHDRRNLRDLVSRAEAGRLDLASLMVRLHCRTWPERALIPAFVFFFRLLYPFAWVNDPARGLAAAAGGCMLVRRAALERIGGVDRIRGELIDDCALARELKAHGRIWLGLADRTVSLRVYEGVGEIWRMVARTAYTQLRYSPLLLAGTVAGLAIVYLVPPVLAFAGGAASVLALFAWAAMSVAYWPMLRFYGRSPLWAPLLPLVALVYLAATIDSARRHWRGRGGEWKGRVQLRGPA
jgi:hopene-associated glycosyltransferase HpnB